MAQVICPVCLFSIEISWAWLGVYAIILICAVPHRYNVLKSKLSMILLPYTLDTHLIWKYNKNQKQYLKRVWSEWCRHNRFVLILHNPSIKYCLHLYIYSCFIQRVPKHSFCSAIVWWYSVIDLWDLPLLLIVDIS